MAGFATYPDDSRLLGDVARQANQPSLTIDESGALDRLTSDVAKALHDVKAVAGARRFFSGDKKRDTGYASAEFLTRFRDSARFRAVGETVRDV